MRSVRALSCAVASVWIALCACLPAATRAVDATSDDASNIVITEIMYNPASGDKREQFIELYNLSTTATFNLGGFKFTSGVKFTFPSVSLGPNQYLVVCADEERIRQLYGIANTVGNWSASSSLDTGGERIRLVNAHTPPVEVEDLTYDDRAPWPVLADGYGHSLERRSPLHDNDDPANWAASQVSSGWARYSVSGLASSSTLYLYLTAAGTAYIDDLKLYPTDDPTVNLIQNGGFESGTLSPWVTGGNHSGSGLTADLAFSGSWSLRIAATGPGQAVGSSVAQMNLSLAAAAPYTLEFYALLDNPGQTIVAGLLGSTGDGSFQVEASGQAATPGKRNSVFTDDLPPFIYSGEHDPKNPKPANDVTLLARAQDDDGTAVAVTAHWDDGTQPASAEMHDDGKHGDGLEGDGVYGVSVGRFSPGSVVRYWFTARDAKGQEGRYPFLGNPTEKLGFYVEPLGIHPSFQLRTNLGQTSTKPPVYHLLIDPSYLEGDPPHLKGDPKEYKPATFVYNGEVFDNVRVRHHGQTSLESPKKKWRVNFNKDHRFLTPFENHPEVDVINIDGSYTDKTFLRDWLSYKASADAGEPGVESWHVRLYLNGDYRGLYLHIEDPAEKEWLSRSGLDKEGWLWKSYTDARGGTNAFALEVASLGTATEGYEALGAFLTGMNTLSGAALVEHIRSNMNVDSFLNYVAVVQLVHDSDSPNDNYLVYADEGTPAGSWTFLGWDRDLTHGRNYECSPTAPGQPGIIQADGLGLYNDTIRYNFFGDPRLLYGTSVKPKCAGTAWNGVVNAFLLKTGFFRPAYYQRVRTLLDQLYRPDVLNPLIDNMAASLSAEAELDWTRTPPYGTRVPYSSHIESLKGYVQARYNYLSGVLDALAAPEIDGLSCERSGGEAKLSWTNRASYTAIHIYRDGVLEDTLPGAVSSATVALDLEAGGSSIRVASVVEESEQEGKTCDVLVFAGGPDEPPVASFSASRRSGHAPLLVELVNTSIRSESFAWDFGDEEASAESSPVHVFKNAGSYKVALTAKGPGGSSQHEEADYVTVTEGVHAELDASPASGQAPLQVAFTNESQGANAFLWRFGDGATSREPSPTHVYASGGVYTVSLTATAVDGSHDTRTRLQLVRVDGPIVAQFGPALSKGLAPLTVRFTDESTGWVTSWRWDFGDGATSAEQHPQHTYVQEGVYAVTLEVFGFATSSVERKDHCVVASNGLDPFVRGDANMDNRVDISDGIAILTYLFVGGLTLDCLDAADIDDGGTVNISDAVRLLTFLFLDGPAPQPPYPGRGVDPTPDSLACFGA